VARYLRWLEDQAAAVKRERERLDEVEARLGKRRAWAEGHAVALLEAVAPGRAKATVGTLTLGVRRTAAVETSEGFDPATLPEAWRRVVPEKVTPARVEIDRKAAGADLLLGYREGEPPGPGWYDVEGHGRMWLECTTDAGTEWASATPPGTPTIAAGGCTLRFLGLAIEPEPGLDVLRWKPSPPGVALVRRVHVRVE
jgi:hypothetical protein